MSPPFRIVNSSRKSLAKATGSNLPAVQGPRAIQKWKRTRGKGNIVAVRWNASAGVVKRTNEQTGWEAYYWNAKYSSKGREAVEKGYSAGYVRLHGSVKDMEEQAARLQNEVEQYCETHFALTNVRYTGTLSSLIKLYRNSEESGYAALKYNIVRTYDHWLNLIDKLYGRRSISTITRKDLFQWHKELQQPAAGNPNTGLKLTKAHDCMRMLRRLIAFGIGLDDHCDRVVRIFATMRFERAAARRQHMTAEYVRSFIKKANELDFPSMALAQAIQFETALRQKDVIGEWWPDKGTQAERHRNRLRVARGLTPLSTETWASGLVWNVHISPNLIMAKPTSKSKFKKLAISDLSLCPMAKEQIEMMFGDDERSGPVIVDESTGLPYREASFRARWRKIADLVGIPQDVKNMDTRSGAITEGSEAGVDLELLRQFGTHSEAAMTQHYNRETLFKARTVHRARTAHRAAPDESKFDHGIIIDAEPVRPDRPRS